MNSLFFSLKTYPSSWRISFFESRSLTGYWWGLWKDESKGRSGAGEPGGARGSESDLRWEGLSMEEAQADVQGPLGHHHRELPERPQRVQGQLGRGIIPTCVVCLFAWLCFSLFCLVLIGRAWIQVRWRCWCEFAVGEPASSAGQQAAEALIHELRFLLGILTAKF